MSFSSNQQGFRSGGPFDGPVKKSKHGKSGGGAGGASGGGGGSRRHSPTPGEPVYAPGNQIRNREILYRLLISQLFYDGVQQIAVQLSGIVNADPPCPPSDRLYHIVMLGLEQELLMKQEESKLKKSTVSCILDSGVNDSVMRSGLDLEFENETLITSSEPACYETAYVTSHKGNCRAGAFNSDSTLCATGSADASIKILDVERMLAKSNMDMGHQTQDQSGHPVIRTLYDHMEEVTCLDFHPRECILASGSKDFSIKLFDYGKVSAKKATRTISDSDQINSISFHPLGDYLIASCDQPVVRLYDVTTSACFVGAVRGHHHTDSVTCVKWSNDGKRYVSASLDGSIKIWDGVSSRCVSTFAQAHDGAEVCSVMFTKNGKYVLSSGRDSLVKLWELSTTRCLIAYTGAGATGRQENRAQAVLNHTEDFVMFPDEATTSLCCWDARNASRKQLLSLGHNGVVRFIVHSQTEPAFLTCSDDFRARFWYKRRSR